MAFKNVFGMETITRYVSLASLALSVGCATSPMKGALIGAGIAGAIGGAIGNAQSIEHRPESTAMGAAIGLAVGGLVAYAIGVDQQKKEPPPAVKLLESQEKVPSLTEPRIRRVWVPDKIEGDKFINGHFIFLIEKQSNWSQ